LALESRDGANLYYTQDPGGPSTLWRMATAGGERERVLDGVILSAFAVVETGIYYIDQHANQRRLQFFHFDSRTSTTVASDLGEVRPLLTASPDGRTILYTRVDSSVNDLMLVENFR
jgi:hypothetical protein